MSGAPLRWAGLGGFAVVAAALPALCAEQPSVLQVRAVTSAAEVAVADRFEVTITATAPSGAIIEAPTVPEAWGAFRVIRSRELPPRATGTGVEHAWVWVLEPTDAGQAATPELIVRAVLPGGQRTQATAAPLQINVVSLLGESPLDTGAPQGLEEPPRIVDNSSWVWGVAGVGAGALATAFAVLGVRAWRRGRVTDELGAAIEDLERASRQAQAAEMTPQALCDLVSRRVRESSKAIDPALAAQTPDGWRTAPAIASPAADLLERCDRVRYANETLTAKDAGALGEAAAELVRGWRLHLRAVRGGGTE